MELLLEEILQWRIKMGKTFKDRKDLNRNYKEISKLKKKDKNRKNKREEFEDADQERFFTK